MTPEQEKILNEIHAAVVGNPAIGLKGIIPRLNELEEYKTRDQKFKNKIAGALAVGTPVLVVAWHWIEKKLGL